MTIYDQHENRINLVLTSNLKLLIEFIGIEFSVDRPATDSDYEKVYGSYGREGSEVQVQASASGIINMSEFEFIPYSPDDAGRFDIGYLYTFDDVRVSDIVKVNRVDSVREHYRVMDKETYGTLSKVVNRLLIKPY